MASKLTMLLLMVAVLHVAATAAEQVVINPAPVDINRATAAKLLTVPGMTASWAGRIVRFRPYHSKLDLVERGVVTAEVYRRIRDGVIAHRVEQEAVAGKPPAAAPKSR